MERCHYKTPPGSSERGGEYSACRTDHCYVVMTTHDGQSTMKKLSDLSRVCRCGRICKNERGLNIHQSKMKCLQPEHNVKRTGKPGETEERSEQEANHSPQNLQAHDKDGSRDSIIDVSEDTKHQIVEGTQDIRQTGQDTCAGVVRKEPMNWLAAVARKEWERFDHDVDEVLETALAGDVGKKLKAMASII